jgi:hypothetical protein
VSCIGELRGKTKGVIEGEGVREMVHEKRRPTRAIGGYWFARGYDTAIERAMAEVPSEARMNQVPSILRARNIGD